MRLIICTIGTSIANGCPSLRGYQQRSTLWNDEAKDLNKELQRKLEDVDFCLEEDIRKASAELNSLHRLNLAPGDHVALLATDTAEGQCCATHLRRVICKIWSIPEGNVHIDRIEGLQVHDETKLRGDGLPNLMRTVMEYCRNWNSDSIILNPTGGFKGVVPFLTVLGMMYRLKTVYVFEFSNALINLPPLPISINEELLTRALPALQHLYKEGAVPESEYLSHIEDYTNEEYFLFRSFVENSQDGFVTLSNVFEPIFEDLVSDVSTVSISVKALKCLQSTDGLNRERLERLIAYATIPLWRSMHIHHFAGSDIPVFKPGNVGERMAALVKEDNIHVCRLYLEHDEYERDLNGLSRSDAESETFTDYKPKLLSQAVHDLVREEKDAIARLEDENRELKSRLERLSVEVKKFREEKRRKELFLKRKAEQKKQKKQGKKGKSGSQKS